MSESEAHNNTKPKEIISMGDGLEWSTVKAGLTHSGSFSSETSSRLLRRAAAPMQALQVDVVPP